MLQFNGEKQSIISASYMRTKNSDQQQHENMENLSFVIQFPADTGFTTYFTSIIHAVTDLKKSSSKVLHI